MSFWDDPAGYALPWAPLAVGAGMTIHNIRQNPGLIDPPSWFKNPAQSGLNMRNEAIRTGLRSIPNSDKYLKMIDNLGTGMIHAGMPEVLGRSAIDEAMRASLLRGRMLSPSDIDKLSMSIRHGAYLGGPQVQGIFDIARGAVAEYGDPRSFYNNLTRITTGGIGGDLFTNTELDDIGKRQYSIIPEHEMLELRNQISDRLPKGWKPHMEFFTTPGQAGQNVDMLRLKLTHEKLPNPVHFNIPVTEGWYRSGRHMESLYATQGILTEAGENISFREHQIRSMIRPGGVLDKILEEEDITKQSIKKTIAKFNEELSTHMVYTPSLKTPGQQILNEIQQKVVGGNWLTKSNKMDDLMGGFYQKGFYPTGTPATIAKGKMLAGFDPRTIWPNALMFPIERRPLQVLREYSPTERAIRAMQKSTVGPDNIFKRETPFLHTKWWKENVINRGQLSPQLAVAYAAPGGKLESELLNRGMAEEELLLKKKIMPMLETYSTREEILSGKEYMSPGLKKRIIKGIKSGKFGKPIDITPDQRLGYGLGTGEEILGAKAPGLKETIVGAEPFTYAGGETGFRLQIRQTHTPKWYAKLFGQLKVTTKVVEDEVIDGLVPGLPHIRQGVDGITYMSELAKNRAFLRMQMQSGLAMSAAQAAAAGNLSGSALEEAQQFISGGWQWAKKNIATEADVLNKAIKWGLPLGPIGGALPYALSESEYEKVLSKVSRTPEESILIGATLESADSVIGLASPSVGGFRYTGGGGTRAKMEPRGFTQLLARGGTYEMIGSEMARSMRGYGTEIQELSKTIQSLAGETPEGVPIVDIKDINVGQKATDISITGGKDYLRKQGYILKAGKHKVYMPSYRGVRGLDMFRLSGGELKAQPMMESLHEFARTAKDLGDTVASKKALDESIKGLRKSVLNSMSVALAGRSKGGPSGALRGYMTGSMSLAPSTARVAPHILELSEAAASDMFTDLSKNAATQAEEEFIKAQRKAFFSGQQIPAVAGRHGLIGPHSLQPFIAQLSRNAESRAGEYFVGVSAPVVKEINLGREIAGIGKAFKTDISPLLGMAMDFDDDRTIVKLIGSKKVNDATLNLMASGKHIDEYQKFAAEAGLLSKVAKSRAAKSAMDIADMSDTTKLVVGSRKLRVGVGSELGELSTALSEAKMAMAVHATPEAAYKFNIISEIMEQQTIGGKHVGAMGADVGKTIAKALGDINEKKNQELLVNKMREMFGTDIEKDIRITLDNKSWTTSVINPKQWVSDAQEALTKFRSSPEGTLYKQMIKGYSGPATEIHIKKMNSMLKMAREGRLDAATALAMREAAITEGAGTKIARDTMGVLNRMTKQTGAAARSWGKPFLYGMLGTAALSMLMGAPNAQPMTPPVAARPSIGRDLRPESMPMPNSVRGQPSAPGMASPSHYMTTSPGLNRNIGQRYRIQAQGNSTVNPEYIQRVMGSVVPGARTNFRYTDFRQALTGQKLQERMEGF